MKSSLVLGGTLLAATLFGGAVAQERPKVYLKHVEPPAHYVPLAQMAHVQGVFDVNLRVASDGTVTSVSVQARNEKSYHRMLATEIEKMVRKWTFGCFDCLPNAAFEHTMVFEYRLEGERFSYENLRVSMDLPETVLIVANPPVVNE